MGSSIRREEKSAGRHRFVEAIDWMNEGRQIDCNDEQNENAASSIIEMREPGSIVKFDRLPQ
jgi:hypothetical protein